jgi:hypothetical protein
VDSDTFPVIQQVDKKRDKKVGEKYLSSHPSLCRHAEPRKRCSFFGVGK